VPGGFADYAGFYNIHAGGIGKKSLGVQFGDFKDAFTTLFGAFEHFVFTFVVVAGEVANIGNIHHMGHSETGAAQGTNQYVVEYISPQIPDMGIIIYRWPAAVKANFTLLYGFKGLLPAAKGIEKAKGH
jgi:hypothetical protein